MRIANIVSILMAGAKLLAAEPSKQPPQPQLGQPGKDVVWLPTPSKVVEMMLDIARVGTNDVVMDLGSGDGRLVIAAARRGARAVGIEYEPDLIELSKSRAAAADVAARTSFLQTDLFEADLSKATVITLFLSASINEKLRPKLLGLKAGTRIVSNTFPMGEWLPDEVSSLEDCDRWCRALLWVVPAQVQGRWRLPQGELTVEQHFQELTGTLTQDGATADIRGGKMVGDQILFEANGAQFSGRVGQGRIKGAVHRAGKVLAWDADKME